MLTKYIRLWFSFLRFSWMQSMEYRQNFIVWMLVDIGWSIMDVIFLQVLISNTGTIGHWTLGQALIVLGIQRLLYVPLWGWFFASFSQLPRTISQGKLDLFLAKPVDSQILVSIQTFSFSTLPSLVTGLIFLILGVKDVSLVISPLIVLTTIWLMLVSVVLIYGVYFLTVASCLFFERLDNIQHLFVNLFDSSRYPKEIYPVVIQRILTSAVPLALMAVVPASSLLAEFSWLGVIWFPVLTVLFIFASRSLWHLGLRRYSSASS
jgi:ABC-2 type transport system permease protein